MRHERSYLAKESGEVFWRIEVEVLLGKLEEFRATVQDLVASSKQEPGTLVYDWFFDADNRVCHTYEHYRDSDAVIAHATTFGQKFAERFRQSCRQIGLDVYGAPNDAAKALLDQYSAAYFVRWQGFESK
jgi:quinol monooxygenase YgiN